MIGDAQWPKSAIFSLEAQHIDSDRSGSAESYWQVGITSACCKTARCSPVPLP